MTGITANAGPSALSIRAVLEDPDRLDALCQLNLLDTEAEEAFDRLTRLASKVLRTPVALFSLVDGDRQFFKSLVGLPEPWAAQRQTPLSHSICQYVVASGQPLIIPDTAADPLTHDNLAIPDLGVLSYAGIPVQIGRDAIGSFCVVDHQAREWLPEEIDILRELAASVMTEVELRLELQARERAEHELMYYAKELEDRNSELDAYSYTIAHDLKAPLSGVVGYANLIQMITGTDQAEIADYADKIAQSGAAMADMIDQLLRLARLRKDEIQPQPVDMQVAVGQALMRFEQQIAAHRIEMGVDHAMPPCLGHEAWVVEVLANLIGNAIKYRGPENTAPEISIGAESLVGAANRYWVRDNGVGIAAADQARLFEGFTRLRTVKDVDGFGLGLSIVRRMIHRMGGEVGVESERGVGSTFWFMLPAVVETPSAGLE
jgi:signal transduction histidine kinase